MTLDFRNKPNVKQNSRVEFEGKKYRVSAIIDLRFFKAGTGFRVFLTKE